MTLCHAPPWSSSPTAGQAVHGRSLGQGPRVSGLITQAPLPLRGQPRNRLAWELYLGDLFGSNRVPAYAAPARAESFAGLPPAYTFIGLQDPFLDETDSGLDIDALKIVSKGVNSLRSPERSMIVITHYQRLLDYIVPDFVHVLAGGRIVRSGGKELASELEEQGYAWIEKGAAPR